MKDSKWLAAAGEGVCGLSVRWIRISSSSQGLGTKGDVIPHPLEEGDPSGPKARRGCWLSVGCPVMS